MTSGEISYRRGPDTSGFLPSQFPYGSRGLQRLLTCYRFIMAMTREDRRRLTIEAMTSSGRDERIAWAVHALDLGAAPSPSLCSLALFSVERISNPWEVDDLFRRSVDELGLARPSPEEYLRQHARDVAEGIVAGTVEPLEGAHILHAIAGALGYPEDLVPWDGFDEDLFLVVGEICAKAGTHGKLDALRLRLEQSPETRAR